MAFIESSKNRVWTLPPDIRDLIPSDHICYLIESFVDMTDFSEFEIGYDGSGHPAYHPCILCKILIQSMLDRVRPSRAIARNARENVVYMYLAENLQPDFRTISDFRKENEKLKVRAGVAKYIKQVNKDESGDRQKEIEETVKEALNEFEKDNIENVSLTDKESRFMINKKGIFELAYNTQITVDHKLGIIVANDVCQDRADMYQLKPQIELVEENCGSLKEGTKISADNGYYCGNNIHYLNQKKLDPYIPEQEERTKTTTENVEDIKLDISNFEYNEENDEFICPENQRLKFLYEGYEKERRRKYRIYKGTECQNCKFSKNCTKRKDGIRHLKIAEFSKERKQLADKMKTEEAKKIFGQRKQVVEPAIGNYKENLGFREFLTRGLKSVRNEFNLVCTAVNLRKIWIYLNKNELIRKEERNKWNFSF